MGFCEINGSKDKSINIDKGDDQSKHKSKHKHHSKINGGMLFRNTK